MVKSYDELFRGIQGYLQNPMKDMEKRIYAKQQECGVCDGKASERIAAALVDILNKTA